MANNKEEKKKIVAEIGEKIKNGSSFVLVDYKGITVAEDTVLRNAFRKEGVDYKVYKNRYLKIALNNLGYTDYDEFLNGTTAIAIGTENPLAPAKIVTDKIAEFKRSSYCSTSRYASITDTQTCRSIECGSRKTTIIIGGKLKWQILKKY